MEIEAIESGIRQYSGYLSLQDRLTLEAIKLRTMLTPDDEEQVTKMCREYAQIINKILR